MKLYLVWQEQNTDYDTYDSFVCAAESEEIARDMQPGADPSELMMDWTKPRRYHAWAFHRDHVLVREIGEALPGTPRSVICSSFNAG